MTKTKVYLGLTSTYFPEKQNISWAHKYLLPSSNT